MSRDIDETINVIKWLTRYVPEELVYQAFRTLFVKRIDKEVRDAIVRIETELVGREMADGTKEG